MVLNRLLSQFNLEIIKDRLFYHHNLYFGSVDFIVTDLLTEQGIQKLVSFLDLPYLPTTNNIDDIYYSITNSKYFSKRLFTNLIYPDVSYKEFLDTIKSKQPFDIYKNVYIPGKAVHIIDKHFNTTLKERVKEFKNRRISRRRVRSRFNGHLIQKWIPEIKPGKLIEDLKKDFKKFIESEFNITFVEYLLDRDPSLIRRDFISYYYSGLDNFDRMFLEDEIPF